MKELVNFVGVFAAHLTEMSDLSDVVQRVESAAEVGLPALRLVDAVRTALAYTRPTVTLQRLHIATDTPVCCRTIERKLATKNNTDSKH